MTPDEAARAYLGALLEIAPDADFTTVTAGADIRRACGLNARQYWRFVDLVGQRAGLPLRHDDADADCLLTLDRAVPFLVNETDRVSLLGL